ncbi:MAG: type I-C CRISPR-associated protein Cas8c/Csd1 [Ruminococcus sp.]|nr:type I-C CRISPR-associated protein Cas8c/Csd1 [Ruminococcus sp.]
MSWISMLCKTYDNNASKAGRAEVGEKPLSRIAHMLANAQVEITIDENGNFQRATEVDKEDRQTLIPITEKSGGRSSGIAAHALSDMLSYVAGDFKDYVSAPKEAEKAEKKFNDYEQGLSEWCESDYAHPKACAVLKYTQKHQTISDLVKSGLVKLDEDGKFAKAKIQGTAYDKCMVRYRVITSKADDVSSATWEDETLANAFAQYYLSEQPGKKDICFVSGKNSVVCVCHPKGILSSSYNSKLISANDDKAFTYLGRFELADGTPNQACTVSYEASQKAHNALSWLVANQGVSYGGRTYICWNPVGKKYPNPIADFGAEIEGDTAVHFKEELRRAFSGEENQLEDNDDIVIMALDAATQGRLSIALYNELKADEFLENYRTWCETVKWRIPDFTPEGKYKETVRTLRTRRIIEYAFGAEQGSIITLNDKILKDQSQRIVNCMISKQRFPQDIAHALAVKASNPDAYSKTINANRVLAYACGAIAKYYNERYSKEGVEYSMELDNKNSNRSYLFGRLLAIGEKVENLAMFLSGSSEDRSTNAERLRSAFVNHPFRTWSAIDDALVPYFGKLSSGTRNYYKELICELLGRISEVCTIDGKLNEGLLNKRLEDVYLIGYSNQFNELNKKTDKSND